MSKNIFDISIKKKYFKASNINGCSCYKPKKNLSEMTRDNKKGEKQRKKIKKIREF